MTSSVQLTISFISHITLNLLKVILSPFRQNLTIFGQLTSGIQLKSDKNILVVIVYYTEYGEFFVSSLVLASGVHWLNQYVTLQTLSCNDWDPHVLHSPIQKRANRQHSSQSKRNKRRLRRQYYSSHCWSARAVGVRLRKEV